MPSPRFLAQIGGDGSPQWVTAVEWSNDGGREWHDATVVSGTVTNSQSSQIRWTASVALTDVTFGRDGINPFTTRFRVRRGLRYSPHEQPEYVGLGVYRCVSCTRSTLDELVTVTGQSFESYVIRSRIYQPITFHPQSAQDAIENPRAEFGRRRGLVTEVLRDSTINWHPGVDKDLPLPRLVAITDRWATVDGDRDARSIAKALGARVFTDGDGIWQVAPVPSLQDLAAWEVAEGVDGVSLGAAEELTSDGVFNVEVVVGTAESEMIGPGIAKDTDPASLTYVGREVDDGGFGEIAADEYQSQMITSVTQAEHVARARLANRLGLRRNLSFGRLHDPTIRAGDVGIVKGFDADNKIILDSVTFDLGSTPGPMQCQTRTQQTRLAGDISDVVEDFGLEGDL